MVSQEKEDADGFEDNAGMANSETATGVKTGTQDGSEQVILLNLMARRATLPAHRLQPVDP